MTNTPIWFDTHTHLGDKKFESDRDAIIQKAFDQNVKYIVEIGDGPDEWVQAQKIAHKYPEQIWWAGGFHPYYTRDVTSDNLKALKDLAADPQFVAVGEVGLDYFKSDIPPDEQKTAFRKGIELALDVNKPLVIHCREAVFDLIPILKEYFDGKSTLSPGVAHCFLGTWEEAQQISDLGFFIGMDGPLTYPKSAPLRETMTKLPLDKLVLETDAPYLPPQGFRGQRNDPSYLPIIGSKLAELRNISITDLAPQLLKNSYSLFRRKHLQ